jgi:hypothetical protein
LKNKRRLSALECVDEEEELKILEHGFSSPKTTSWSENVVLLQFHGSLVGYACAGRDDEYAGQINAILTMTILISLYKRITSPAKFNICGQQCALGASTPFIGGSPRALMV